MRQCTPAAKPLCASKAIVVNKRRARYPARRFPFVPTSNQFFNFMRDLTHLQPLDACSTRRLC